MAATAAARLECTLVAHHYLGRIWALSITAANAAAAAKAEADGAPPPTAWVLPDELHEWTGWAADDELRALMAASGSEKMICATSFPKPQLSACYLQYCINTLLEHNLTLHALMPLALLRVVAADLLKQPAMERVALLQTAHLQLQIGMTDAADATRALIGPLG
eukprot:2763220-Prymnesium_polylepis.1